MELDPFKANLQEECAFNFMMQCLQFRLPKLIFTQLITLNINQLQKTKYLG